MPGDNKCWILFSSDLLFCETSFSISEGITQKRTLLKCFKSFWMQPYEYELPDTRTFGLPIQLDYLTHNRKSCGFIFIVVSIEKIVRRQSLLSFFVLIKRIVHRRWFLCKIYMEQIWPLGHDTFPLSHWRFFQGYTLCSAALFISCYSIVKL